MTQVNYDSSTNSLKIWEDNRPCPKFQGSEYSHETALKNYAAHLRKCVDNINEWLYNDASSVTSIWIERRRLANGMLVKIQQINDRLSRKTRQYGMCELSYPGVNNITNKQFQL